MLCVSLGVVVGAVITKEEGDYSEVMAMMESDTSNQEKIIFLEKRYDNEMGRLDLLLNHSDLCSSKYLNELSTLSISFEATKAGYEKLGESIEYENYKNINQKINDYYEIIVSFDEMYESIDLEEYEKAIEELEEIEELREKVYANVEKEIAEVE